MSKKIIHDYFPEERIALNKEIKNHPRLLRKLAESDYDNDDFLGKLEEIAAYCMISLDGWYTQDNLNILCDKLILILKAKRQIVLTTPRIVS